MAKKIDAQMSTEVYLGTLQASKSLKNLKTAVTSVTNAWKAQNTALKSSGDNIKAAQVKYDGLGKSIKANEAVVNGLREKQKGLDQTTQDGARQYAKYQAEINRTETRIASLSKQQERAASSLNAYKSGIIGIEQSIKSSTQVTQSYVDRLRAEGKELKALRAESAGYRENLSKTTTLYSKQTTELKQYESTLNDLKSKYEQSKTKLDQLTKAGKENSSEYRKTKEAVQSYKNEMDSANSNLNRQKIRVNETATSMAKLKTSINKVGDAERKIHPTGLNRLVGGLEKVNKKTEKTEHLFGSIFGGQLLANGVISAWNSITNHISDAVREGAEYDKTQQKMLATWTTLTGSAKKGQAMVDTTNKLSVALGQDVDVTDELNQQFYHVLDKQKPTERLTKSVLTMADAVGLSSENTKNLGLNFTHMMSSSKMQLGDFNHITDALPMYGHALLEYEQKVQKNSKLTMSELRKQMSAGKISAEDAEKVMNNLGDKYKEASENLMKTLPGMERVIKARVPALLGAIEKPFMKAQNPILGAVSKWVSDKKTEKEFTKLGKATSLGMNTIMKAFAKVYGIKNTTHFLDSTLTSLTKTVTKFSKYIADHAGDIKSFFEIFKSVGSANIKVFAATLKALLPAIKVIGDFAEKHPKLFGDMVAGMIMANGAMKVFNLTLSPTIKMLSGLSKVTSWGKKLLGFGTDAELAAGKLNPLKKALSSIGGLFKGSLKEGKGLLGGLLSGKGAISGLKSLGKSGGAKGILKSLGKGALSATPLDAVLSATELIGMNKKNKGEKIGRATGSFAGGAAGAAIGTAILPGIGTVLGGIGGTLLGTKLGGAMGKGIQKNVKKWGKWIKNAFTGKLGWEKSIGKSLSKVGKTIKKTTSGWAKSIGKVFGGIGKVIGKAFKGVAKFFSPLTNAVKKVFGGIAKVIRGMAKTITSALKWAIVIPIALVVGLAKIAFSKLKKPILSVTKAIAKAVRGTWNGIKKVTSVVFGAVAKTTSKVWGGISKTVGRVVKSITKVVKGAWNGLKKATSVTWGAIKKYVVNPVVSIYKTVEKYIVRLVVKSVKNAWSSVKKATSAAWKLIKKYVVNPVVDVYRTVEKYFNKYVVKTVKSAWNTVKNATSEAWKLIEHYIAAPVKKIYLTVKKWIDKVKWYWSKIWNSVVKFTENIWNSIKKKVGNGLGSIAKVINSGIKSINWVISKFGGKKNTIGYLPTHYATGTGATNGGRRPITKPTHVVLNDGNDSPETGNKELAVLPDGRSFVPPTRNWEGVVPAHTEIYNATETKNLFQRAGAPVHFASGTGILGDIMGGLGKAGSWLGDKVSGTVDWVKNAFGSMKSLVSTAGKILAHPVDSLKQFFTDKLGMKGIAGAVQQGFAGIFKNQIVNQAKSWWSAAWDLINNAIGDSGDDAGGEVRHSPGAGWVITSGFGNRGAVAGGFSAHDGVDFSGAKTVHAMNTGIVKRAGGPPAGWGGANGIGEHIDISGGGLNYIYQELNGKYGSGAKLLVKKGDHVKAGQAIAVLGPSGTHVHVGATKHPMFSISGSSTKGWLDPTKIKSIKTDSKDKNSGPKVSGSLEKFVKGQLGSGMFDWIAKHLAPLTDALNLGSGGGDYDPDMIRKAARAMKVNPSNAFIKLLQAVIQSESGGKNIVQQIHDVNSGGNEARGILQYTPPTFKAFAMKGHTNIMNPYDQLLAFFNNSDWKHSIGMTTIWGHRKADWLHSGPIGHRRFENGGIVGQHQMVEVAEHNHPEAIVPLSMTKRSRGWELIGKVAATFAQQEGLRNQTVATTDNSDYVTKDQFDQLLTMMDQFMELVAQKPTGISERQVYDAYNRQKGRHYQLDSIKKG